MTTSDGMIIVYVFAIWAACSLIMTFFSAFIEKYTDVDDEGSYYIAALGPFTLPIFIVVIIFVAVRIAGKKVFGRIR